MSQFATCPVCKEVTLRYRGAPAHKCPPRWAVWSRALGLIRPESVYAKTAALAANRWGRRHRVHMDLEGDQTAVIDVCPYYEYPILRIECLMYSDASTRRVEPDADGVYETAPCAAVAAAEASL